MSIKKLFGSADGSRNYLAETNQKNLFKDVEAGYLEKDLLLRNDVVAAKPMLAGNTYKFHFNIYDKKSDAYYHWKKDFKVVENPMITTKTDGITYSTLYLYSKDRDLALIDDKMLRNEKVYIILENAKGFTVDENGNTNIFVSVSLKDAKGNLILKPKNLFDAPINAKDLNAQLHASFTLTPGKINNPITCEFIIKDISSGNNLTANFELNVDGKKL